MTKCSENDCPHDAGWAIKLYVPPVGLPANEDTALWLVLGVPLCRRHAEEFKVDQVMDVPNELGSTLRKDLLPTMAKMACRNNGRPYIPPDCDRAWIAPIRLSSREYQALRSRRP